MKEGLFFALLAFSGYGLFFQLFGPSKIVFGVAVAVPLGVLQWTLLAIVMLLSGVALQNVFWLLALLSLFYCWVASRRFELAPLMHGLAAACAAMLISVFSVWCNWVQVSFDSVEQVTIGRTLAQTGLTNDTGASLASWGVLVPLLQGASAFLGIDLLTGAQPLFWLSLLGILAATAWQISFHKRGILTLLAVSLVATPYLLIFQSAYIHNSLVSATFLLLFMGAIFLSAREGCPRWLELAFLGLLGFTLARTEAPLFAALAILLVASLFDRGPLWPYFQRLTIIYAISTTTWYVVLMMLIGAGSDIMTPGRIGILIAATLGAAMVATCPANRLSMSFRAWMPVIVVVTSLIANGLGYLWKPEHFLQNIDAIRSNLFFSGRWGAAWWTVAFVLPLLLSLNQGSKGRVLVAFFVAFSSLVILLGIMRIPYRVGWGDSANRIFTHLLPLIALWTICVLSPAKLQTAPKSVENTTILPPLKAFVIGCCISVPIVFASFLYYWQAVRIDTEVIIRRAEGFCPPDSYGHYNFQVALIPDSPDSYAAACASGPRTVELEIISEQQFRWIDLQEYSQNEAWTDFGVRISPDGVHWTSVFEYSPENLSKHHMRIGSAKWRIEMPTNMTARFIAIDYRASLGQNRLLLRRASLVKK
jgi:hypothetical protein